MSDAENRARRVGQPDTDAIWQRYRTAYARQENAFRVYLASQHDTPEQEREARAVYDSARDECSEARQAVYDACGMPS